MKEKPTTVEKATPNVYTDLEGTFDTGTTDKRYTALNKHQYEWTIDINPSYIVRLNIHEIVKPDLVEISISDVRNGLANPLFTSAEIKSNFDKNKVNYLTSSNKIRVVATLDRSSVGQPMFKFSHKAERVLIDRSQSAVGTNQYNLTNGVIQMPKSLIKEKIVWLIKAPREYQVIARIKSSSSTIGQLVFSLLGKLFLDHVKFVFNF
jgi:hypothetical protein